MNPVTEMIFYACAQAANILFLLAVAGVGVWILAWAVRKPPTPRLRNSLMRELLDKDQRRGAVVTPITQRPSCIVTEDVEL